jgi:hypothetical protein
MNCLKSDTSIPLAHWASAILLIEKGRRQWKNRRGRKITIAVSRDTGGMEENINSLTLGDLFDIL